MITRILIIALLLVALAYTVESHAATAPPCVEEPALLIILIITVGISYFCGAVMGALLARENPRPHDPRKWF